MVLRNNKDFPNKVFGNKKDSAQIFCWVDGCAGQCGDGKELKVIYVHAFDLGFGSFYVQSVEWDIGDSKNMSNPCRHFGHIQRSESDQHGHEYRPRTHFVVWDYTKYITWGSINTIGPCGHS